MNKPSFGEALHNVTSPFAKFLTWVIALGCLFALGAAFYFAPAILRQQLYDNTDQKNAVTVTVYDLEGKCMGREVAPSLRINPYGRQAAIAACARQYPSKATFIPESYQFHKFITADPNPVFIPHNRAIGDSRLTFIGPGGALFGRNRMVPKSERPWGQ